MRPPTCLVALLLPILAAFALPARAPASHSQPASEPGIPHSSAAEPIVAIQPLGELDRALVNAVAARIRATFAVHTIVLHAKPLPELAFYQPRRRFRGDRLVDWLEATRPSRTTKILGLMSRDLSVTKGRTYDWGVMGVAGLRRSSGVISTYRLSGHHASESLVRQRLCQVAVHELGHTLGLHHCDTARCIMNDAEGGIASVDGSSGEFCRSCRSQLGDLLRERVPGFCIARW